jgi:hypothetical protein
VHTALQEAMEAAGIDSPYSIQTVNLHVESGMMDRLSRGWGEQDEVA